jgi:hypothetical protein
MNDEMTEIFTATLDNPDHEYILGDNPRIVHLKNSDLIIMATRITTAIAYSSLETVFYLDGSMSAFNQDSTNGKVVLYRRGQDEKHCSYWLEFESISSKSNT